MSSGRFYKGFLYFFMLAALVAAALFPAVFCLVLVALPLFYFCLRRDTSCQANRYLAVIRSVCKIE